MSNSSINALVGFSEKYAKIHGRIVFPLTIFGVLTSIVTIIVLNRKNFRTPTNLILQHVAFFDTIVLISYNIYSLYFYILHQPNPFVGQSKFWPHFAIFHSSIGLTAHSIALWLTCLLAIIRYTIISKPKQIVINSVRINILIWNVVVFVCLLMIPNFLTWSVVRQPAHTYLPHLYGENSTETVYWFSTTTGEGLEKLSFVILAICFKILPVFILIVFSILLILTMRHARESRERLCSRTINSLSSTLSVKRELRTTTMLVLITSCTVLVEFPQGILFIASGIDKDFFLLYSHLGDIWDITSIGSSFITFIMYCLMSQQFRMEIYQLILPKYFKENLNLMGINDQTNHLINLNKITRAKQNILVLTETTPMRYNV